MRERPANSEQFEITQRPEKLSAIRLSLVNDEREIGRAYLCLLPNEHHPESVGYLEDVFVEEEFRGQQLGTKLIAEAINAARDAGCYKLVATSRYGRDGLHQLYLDQGFSDHGKEFRLDL